MDNKRWMNPALNTKLLKALKAIELEGFKELCDSGNYGNPNFGKKYVHNVWDALHIIDQCQDWYGDLYYSGFPTSVRDNIFSRRFNFLGVIRYFLELAVAGYKDIVGGNIWSELANGTVYVTIGTSDDPNSPFPVCSEIIAKVYGNHYRHKLCGIDLVKFLTDYCSTAETKVVKSMSSPKYGEEVVVFNLSVAMTEFIEILKKEQEANYKEYVG